MGTGEGCGAQRRSLQVRSAQRVCEAAVTSGGVPPLLPPVCRSCVGVPDGLRTGNPMVSQRPWRSGWRRVHRMPGQAGLHPTLPHYLPRGPDGGVIKAEWVRQWVCVCVPPFEEGILHS